MMQQERYPCDLGSMQHFVASCMALVQYLRTKQRCQAYEPVNPDLALFNYIPWHLHGISVHNTWRTRNMLLGISLPAVRTDFDLTLGELQVSVLPCDVASTYRICFCFRNRRLHEAVNVIARICALRTVTWVRARMQCLR